MAYNASCYEMNFSERPPCQQTLAFQSVSMRQRWFQSIPSIKFSFSPWNWKFYWKKNTIKQAFDFFYPETSEENKITLVKLCL